MSIERWRQIEELFSEALEQPAAMRTPFVERRCEDPGMRDELASLLRAADLSGQAGNIFLTPDGGVRILDFGIAALASDQGLAGGTAGYVAPEQLRGESVDGRYVSRWPGRFPGGRCELVRSRGVRALRG